MDKASNHLSWLKALQRAKSNNEQLEFWRFVNIAYICSKTNTPEVDMLKFRDFHVKDNSNAYLLFSIDNRCKMFHDLTQCDKVELCWFFPLSREKFRIKCSFKSFSLKNYSDKSSADQIIGYQEFKNIWDKEIDKEEKKLFTERKPDTKTVEISAKQVDDINDFNTPTVDDISPNFAILATEVQEGN